VSWSLIAGGVWAFILLIGYGGLACSPLQPLESARRAAFIVAFAAAVARLIPNFLLPMGASYDIESYRIVSDLVLGGRDVYASPQAADRHPYLPFQMYWMACARWLAGATGVRFVKVARLAPIGADVAIALVLFFFLRRIGSPRQALRGGLLYALNPVPVFVSAYHGQFDAIPTLFLLLSVMAWHRSSLAAGGWLGLGILSKSWPVLALPSLWAPIEEWRQKVLFVVGTAIAPLLGIAVYLLLFRGQTRGVLTRALGYDWGIGVWGYTYLFRLASILKPELTGVFHWLMKNARYLALIALGLAWILKARKEPPEAGILTVLVTFFAVTHAFSVQYLMWVVPFAVLNGDHRWLTRYTLAAFAYMFLAYTTLILERHITGLLPWPQADWFLIMPAGLPVWLVTLGWMGKRLRASGKGCRWECPGVEV
jgi:hypothetical protein